MHTEVAAVQSVALKQSTQAPVPVLQRLGTAELPLQSELPVHTTQSDDPSQKPNNGSVHSVGPPAHVSKFLLSKSSSNVMKPYVYGLTFKLDDSCS